MFWLELIVVLGMLLVGARVGGIFLGMSSGVSLAVLIFGFGCTPGKPPIEHRTSSWHIHGSLLSSSSSSPH